MKWFIAATTLFLLIPNSSFAWQSRLDQKGIDRIIKYQDHFVDASEKYKIPLDKFLGVVYNESNGRNVIGDAGYAYSLGQVRCSYDSHRFSWLPFLKKKKIGINKCSDLSDPKKNIVAVAEIISHHKKREIEWDKTMMAYHLGIFWKKQKRRAYSYYKKVEYFGDKLEPIIKRNIVIQSIDKFAKKATSWLIRKSITVSTYLREAKVLTLQYLNGT